MDHTHNNPSILRSIMPLAVLPILLPISDGEATSRCGVVAVHYWNTAHTSECTDIAIIVFF